MPCTTWSTALRRLSGTASLFLASEHDGHLWGASQMRCYPHQRVHCQRSRLIQWSTKVSIIATTTMTAAAAVATTTATTKASTRSTPCPHSLVVMAKTLDTCQTPTQSLNTRLIRFHSKKRTFVRLKQTFPLPPKQNSLSKWWIIQRVCKQPPQHWCRHQYHRLSWKLMRASLTSRRRRRNAAALSTLSQRTLMHELQAQD